MKIKWRGRGIITLFISIITFLTKVCHHHHHTFPYLFTIQLTFPLYFPSLLTIQLKDMENTEENSEKIGKIWKNIVK
jgi:hypothetical protein